MLVVGPGRAPRGRQFAAAIRLRPRAPASENRRRQRLSSAFAARRTPRARTRRRAVGIWAMVWRMGARRQRNRRHFYRAWQLRAVLERARPTAAKRVESGADPCSHGRAARVERASFGPRSFGWRARMDRRLRRLGTGASRPCRAHPPSGSVAIGTTRADCARRAGRSLARDGGPLVKTNTEFNPTS